MTMRAFAGIFLSSLLCNVVCAQSTDTPPTFEVADVHVSPNRLFPFMDGGFLRGDRYVLRQATMADLIATAYGVDASNVQGGPIWLETDRFDVIAKAPPTTSPATVKLMLRSLLADRFKLVTHTGSAPMPAFVLTAGKGPPKMKQAEDSGEADCKYQEPPQNPAPDTVPSIVFSCHHTTMEEFAKNVHEWAGGYLTDPVVDSTGLKGSWDFDIKWTPRQALQKAGADGLSIFDAVDKELGLKLERQTAPRPVLIVDSVNQKPTANPPGLEKSLPSPPPPQFDVAVIKPSKPDAQFRGRINGGQVDVVGAPLKFMITFAWDLNPNDEEVLVGAPKWLESDHFDILAKVVSDAPSNLAAKAPRIDIEDLRQMMQALLKERFKLQAHMEDRPVSAYTLIAVKPKLTKAASLSRTRCKEGPGPDGKDPRIANPVLNRLVSCQNMTMEQICEELQRIASGYVYSSVLDTTGIKGSWDFTLSFSSADLTKAGAGAGPPAGGAATSSATSTSDPNGALTLFDAVSKELGLKLEKQRRPAPVLVIDHIEEKPTEN
jgi:uncharacterized protein (TIGR03435 family)